MAGAQSGGDRERGAPLRGSRQKAVAESSRHRKARAAGVMIWPTAPAVGYGKTKMPCLTINHTPVEVEEGTKLLAAIEKAGVRVPTLCHHKALTPYGACRLCVVEVQASGRPPVVQASCSYPALDGISVLTHTDRVTRARRIVAELLLARAPDSGAVRAIAAELGVHETRIRKKNDNCILRPVRKDVRGKNGTGRHRFFRERPPEEAGATLRQVQSRLLDL